MRLPTRLRAALHNRTGWSRLLARLCAVVPGQPGRRLAQRMQRWLAPPDNSHGAGDGTGGAPSDGRKGRSSEGVGDGRNGVGGTAGSGVGGTAGSGGGGTAGSGLGSTSDNGVGSTAGSGNGGASGNGDGIVRHATDAILTFDADLRIAYANPAAASLFGYTEETLRTRSLADLLSPLPALPQDTPIRFFGEGGGGRGGRRLTDWVITGIRADGSTFPAEGSLARLPGPAPSYSLTLRDVSEQLQIQQNLSRSYTQLRQLSAALQSVREEERTHIARELHDDLGQLLASLRMDLALLKQEDPNNARAVRLMKGMEDNLLMAITSLRRIAANLRPRALDQGGLYYALQGLRDEFAARHGIACQLYADEADLRLTEAASTAIFRIVQEALTNIARHSGAQHVTLSLYRINGELLVSIRDDGCGIQPGDLEKSQSLGLVGMRERVWALHGDITIGPDEPGGTRIDVVLPLAPHLAGGAEPPTQPRASNHPTFL